MVERERKRLRENGGGGGGGGWAESDGWGEETEREWGAGNRERERERERERVEQTWWDMQCSEQKTKTGALYKTKAFKRICEQDSKAKHLKHRSISK